MIHLNNPGHHPGRRVISVFFFSEVPFLAYVGRQGLVYIILASCLG